MPIINKKDVVVTLVKVPVLVSTVCKFEKELQETVFMTVAVK